MPKRKIPLLCQIRFGGITFLISRHLVKEQYFSIYLSAVSFAVTDVVHMTDIRNLHTLRRIVDEGDDLPSS